MRAGIDPLEDRETAKARQVVEEAEAKARGTTFREAAAAFIADKRGGWSNDKHAAQWLATLEAYAFPILGDLAVGEIDRDRVLAVLRPIWEAKPETASRVRGRIANILDYATVSGWRAGDNPARWKGNLALLLSAKPDVIEHHPALPWRLVPRFWVEMDETSPITAMVLRFQILTAARPSEARLLYWRDLDIPGATWNVPAAKMKARKFHRVPLSEPALAILAEMARLFGADPEAWVFPGAKPGKPWSDPPIAAVIRRMNGDAPRWTDPKQEQAPIVPHGFRSSFRDWAYEATDYPHDLAEEALAHPPATKVLKAYRRADALDKRRAMMADWGRFVTTPP